MKHLSFIPLAILLSALLIGCDREGPAEEFGENIDETAEDIGNEIEDACEEAKDEMGAEDEDC